MPKSFSSPTNIEIVPLCLPSLKNVTGTQLAQHLTFHCKSHCQETN